MQSFLRVVCIGSPTMYTHMLNNDKGQCLLQYIPFAEASSQLLECVCPVHILPARPSTLSLCRQPSGKRSGIYSFRIGYRLFGRVSKVPCPSLANYGLVIWANTILLPWGYVLSHNRLKMARVGSFHGNCLVEAVSTWSPNRRTAVAPSLCLWFWAWPRHLWQVLWVD